MDIAAFIFTALLFAIGLALIVFVRVGSVRGDTSAGEDVRALRQRELRAERQMQRKRWRVWHRVDELHARFVESAAARERELTLLPAEAAPAPRQSGEDFTAPDIDAAYELFVREDFLKAGHAQVSRKSAERA